MSVVIVAIIILTGYIFSNRYPLARFRQLRAKGWADYGHLLSYGILFSAISSLLVGVLDLFNIPTALLHYFLRIDLNTFLSSVHISFSHAQFIIWALISLLIAFSTGIRLSGQKYILAAATQLANENEFEKILYTSSMEQKTIQISLKSGKVYIGIVNQMLLTGDLNKTEYFTIFPLYSGYRDKENQVLHLTNSYTEFYKNVRSAHQENQQSQDNDKPAQAWEELLANFKTLIISAEVVSLAYFNFDDYKTINSKLITDKRRRPNRQS